MMSFARAVLRDVWMEESPTCLDWRSHELPSRVWNLELVALLESEQ